MQSQKSIAILVDWFLPGYKAGGPIRSCANIIAHLKNDFSFSVITADCDANETTPYQGIKSNTWNIRTEGTNVFYFSKTFSKYKNLKALLLNGSFQVWYMNSLFSVFFTLFPLIIARFNNVNAKLIVAPRGMLGDGALQIKPFKKKIFLFVSNTLGLYKNVVWHASTQLEKEEIQKHFGANAIVEVALNLSEPSEILFKKRTKLEGKIKLVFFSRISIKKNLHLVFEFLKNINRVYKVDFDIYGLKEEESYWQQCENAIRQLPSNITATYKGAIDNTQLKEALSQYHFSILPTMHENYGHSIVESWAAGCPVIISENTPWRNLEKEKCGWDILLNNSNKFAEALNVATAMNQQTFNEWSTACVEKAKLVMQNNVAVDANRKLFAT
ncbi:MAG TPA: glycosyltransferase family 4 protein [Bacteroidia bacterium]|nr:glycosyltransferase family 4 protein [Bacteroidia bacterium]HNU32125.1 glycosyltransferase family 4 protein [Bacteroidia bacterium]